MLKKSKFFELLAVEVAGGSMIRDASEKIGCGVSTGYNISCDPSFRVRVGEIRSESVASSVGKLSKATSRAVDVLVELLDASNAPLTRLNACKTILASLSPLSELGELRQRLDILEAITSDGGG